MRPLLLIAFLTLLHVAASAQKLTGQVIDQTSQQPIVGATVQVKRTQAGALTNATGTFTLTNLKPADLLVFSYLGYKSQEVSVHGSDRSDD